MANDWKSRAQKVDWKSKAEKVEESQGPLETYAETVADELSLGYYPQMAAGVKSALYDVDYATQRDIERKELQKGQQENPTASVLGTGTAIFGQMAIPAGGALKLAQAAKAGSPILKKAAIETVKNIGLGSVISALKNPGDVAGAIEPFQPEKRLENVISDLPLNIATGVAGGVIDSKAAKKAAEAPKQIISAMKPTPTKASVLIQDNAKRAKEVGDFIFDRGIVKPGDDPSIILSKAETEVRKAGEKLFSFLKNTSKKIDENKSIQDIIQNPSFNVDRDLPELYSIIESELVKSGTSDSAKVAGDVIQQIVSDFDSLKRVAKIEAKKQGAKFSDQLALNLEGLNQMKRFMQDQVANWDRMHDVTKEAPAVSEAYNMAANYFSKKVEQELSRLGDDSVAKALKNLNKDYSLAADARGLANRNAVRNFLKQDQIMPIMSGLGTSGLTYSLTKDPAVSAMVGATVGAATSKMQNLQPTTIVAFQKQLPNMLSRNIIPKTTAYVSAMQSTPEFQQAQQDISQALMQGAPPFVLDKEVQKSPLSPTEKAQLRKQITEQGTN